MTITTLTGRELNHDMGRAKKVSLSGPVFIANEVSLRPKAIETRSNPLPAWRKMQSHAY